MSAATLIADILEVQEIIAERDDLAERVRRLESHLSAMASLATDAHDHEKARYLYELIRTDTKDL